MKTAFKFFAAGLAIVAAASCSKEMTEVQESGAAAPEGKVFKTFTGTSEATKGDLNGLVPTWTVGDSLKVYDDIDPATDNKFFVTAVDGATVTFEGSVSAGATTFKAVYPYAAGSNWDGTDEKKITQPAGDTLKVNITGYQYIPAGKHIAPDVLVSVAYWADGSAISFKNIISLAKFTISQANVKEVKFYAAKGQLTVLASTGKTSKDAAYNAIAVRPKDNTYFETGDYYAAVGPCKVKGMTLVCKVGDELKWKQDTTVNFNFVRNGGYNLKTVDNGRTLVAKWMFKTPFNSTNSTNFACKTTAVGYGKNAAGNTAYVGTEFAGSGRIKYYQSTTASLQRKVETNAKSKYSLTAGAAVAGDYWEFSVKDSLSAGTKLHAYINMNHSGSKKVSIYVWDGAQFYQAVEEMKLNTTEKYSTFDYEWTLASALSGSSYTPLVKIVMLESGNWPRIYDRPTDGDVDMAPYIEIAD